MLGIFFNGYVFSLFACNLILICKKQEKTERNRRNAKGSLFCPTNC